MRLRPFSDCVVIDMALAAANLVLEDTWERIYHEDVFAELHRGLFLIRGENVVLLGEIVRRLRFSRHLLLAELITTPPRT